MTPGIWHYLMELLVFVSLAYFAGCLFGASWRSMTASAPLPQADVAATNPVMERAAPHAMAPATPAPVAAAEISEPLRMSRPKGLDAARNGRPDDLQRISGVGPKNEKVLHSLGFFHFDQIADWTAEQVKWVDDHLNFNGRIGREEWINQCRLLADGNEAEFARLYGTGGQKGPGGDAKSGSRTRRS